MFSDLAAIRTGVKDALTPVLPDSWDFVEYLVGEGKTTRPVVYLEYTAAESTVNGGELGAGQVAASFNIIITDPKTDTAKAENDVDRHLVRILAALDARDDIFWARAAKRRLDTGEMAWAIDAFALAEYPIATTTEES